MNLKEVSIQDLAIYVCDQLAQAGIETVLSGGACVSIYTHNEFLSFDLDFVLLDLSKKKDIRRVLGKMGFQPEGRHFRHGDTPFIVEFLSPPLAVGEEPVKKIHTIEKNDRTLNLLSPTDCVKDRLAAFYHWNDRPSLEQSVIVSKAQTVDMKEIERWSANEGMLDKYPVYVTEFNRQNRNDRES